MPSAADSRAVDSSFRLYGEDAVYTPAGGGAGIPCKVIPYQPQVADRAFMTPGFVISPAKQLVAREVEVRRTEIALPEKDGTIAITAEGKTYPIKDGIEFTDASKLVWKLPLGPGV